MNQNLKKIIKLMIGIGIISLLIYKAGIRNLYYNLLQINTIWVIPYILVHIGTIGIGTVNINILLKAINKKIKFSKLIKYVSLGQVFGLASPGKLGEFGIIRLLKKENVEYGEGLAISLIDKIITVLTLLLLGSIALMIILPKEYMIYPIIILIIILILSIIIIFIKSLIKKYLLKKYSKYLENFSNTFKFIINKRKGAVVTNFIITVLKWILLFINVNFLFLAFNQKISLISIIGIISVVQIISLLPISISGLGVKEISGAYLFSLQGIDLSIATNVLLTATALYYLISLAFYILFHREI